MLEYFENHPDFRESTEYNVNRISALAQQKGICPITQTPLKIGEIETHHKNPIAKGGTHQTSNLVMLNKVAHKMITTTNITKLQEQYKYLLQRFGEIIKPKSLTTKLNKYKKLIEVEKVDYRIFQ